MNTKVLSLTLILWLGLHYVFTTPTMAVAGTYYVRPDGGTSEQCTGMADAPYPGSGNSQACAWSHPFWALQANSGTVSWKIQGGDTILISQGSYKMGFGAPNSGWCSSYYPWDCYLPPLPSGPDANNPTRLLGRGSDQGCSNPPELWGTERAYQVLDLSGTSNAIIECLEITDHSGCVEFHANPQVRCQRDSYPFGNWASTGIYASDSRNITLRHINVHGLAAAGIHAARLSDWTVEDVRIAANGWVGWDGDIYGSDSNSGVLAFKRWIVEWNGCSETYPDKRPDHCWDQQAGGYGDGVGTGATGGHWIVEDSVFRYNTSDGLDLLYVGRVPGEESSIEIRRTRAYGNAGNQIKTNGPTKIENALIVGNCAYFENKPFGQEMSLHCRAAGAALSLDTGRGHQISVVNSTVVGQGDCLATFECGSGGSCNGSERLTVQNNIFRGYQDFFDPSDLSCYFWFDRDHFYDARMNYNVIYNAKVGDSVPIGPNDIFEDPLFINDNLENFDGHLAGDVSPAADSGLPVGALNGLIPDHDLEGNPRPRGNAVDHGAYEYSDGEVEPPIIDAFGANINEGPAPFNTKFTASCRGQITNWRWVFGDNSGSTKMSPSHTYSKPGIYSVSLTVTGLGGSVTESRNNYIKVRSPIVVTVPNGGETWQRGTVETIHWNFVRLPGKYVRIDLLKGDLLNRTISPRLMIGRAGDGSYKWRIPPTITPGNDYKIRITTTSGPVYGDVSDNYLSISR